jgi:uncharacterized membrane protein YkvA (DUF1232 family)
MPNDDKFTASYSDDSFWDKVKTYAKSAGEEVLEPALKMYYAALDADTPSWAKATIFAALGCNRSKYQGRTCGKSKRNP